MKWFDKGNFSLGNICKSDFIQHLIEPKPSDTEPSAADVPLDVLVCKAKTRPTSRLALFLNDIL